MVDGASPTASGLMMIPLMAGVLSASVAAGRTIARTGRYRWFPLVGTMVIGIGMLLLSTLDVDTSLTTASAFMVILGLGIGMTMQPLMLIVQNSAPPRDMGVAVSTATFFRSIGGSAGVALFGAVFASRLSSELADHIPKASAAGVDPDALTSAPQRIRALPGPVRDGAMDAFTAALHSVFLYGAGLGLLAFAVALAIREIPLKTTSGAETGPISGATPIAEEAAAAGLAHTTPRAPATTHA